MFQNKKQIKITILILLTIIFISQFSLSSLAKTEVYFSLSDNPQKEIIKNINRAQASINIAMYIFTDREIALPLIKAQPLLTGSYNWTFSANNRNDENLMVTDDPEIIEIFQNQFINLWTNKYSPERTRQLYKIAKVDFLPTSPAPPKTEAKIININSASLEELTNILQISEPLAQKIIAFPFMLFPRTRESIILREKLGGFNNPQDLLQLPELTTFEWQEWKEQGIVIDL